MKNFPANYNEINYQTTTIEIKKKKFVYDKNKLTKIFFKPIFKMDG